MPDYRRARTAGGTYFFTVVTHDRQPFLTDPIARTVLREVVRQVRQQYPFTIDAWVLLPEHIHCLWTLPAGDADFSKRWGLIKAGFSKGLTAQIPVCDHRSASRQRHRESSLWQRRFWEHQIRDDEDFRRHVDYIHYNPVKHCLVSAAADWPYSTFHRHVARGDLPLTWGIRKETSREGDFGE